MIPQKIKKALVLLFQFFNSKKLIGELRKKVNQKLREGGEDAPENDDLFFWANNLKLKKCLSCYNFMLR